MQLSELHKVTGCLEKPLGLFSFRCFQIGIELKAYGQTTNYLLNVRSDFMAFECIDDTK